MKIRAATLAGGKQNQDAYIIGDNFAGVFDGASNHLQKGNVASGAAWYSHALGEVLRELMLSSPSLEGALQDAIRIVGSHFEGSPETCPTSTVALARWTAESIETCLLGDSSIFVLKTDTHVDEIKDERMASVGSSIRDAYRDALRAGRGYGPQHRERLAALQAKQLTKRNKRGGYWVAGADPLAAAEAVTLTYPRAEVSGIILATDGARSALDYELVKSPRQMADWPPEDLLRAVHEKELSDPSGKRWPRSKKHDDKTLVSIYFDAAT